MVYVPWQDLGICKFWAMHRTTCDFIDTCKWSHPPDGELKRVWDHYAGREFAPDGSALPPRPPPPPPSTAEAPPYQYNQPRPQAPTFPQHDLPPRPTPMMHPDRAHLTRLNGAHGDLSQRPRLPPAPAYRRDVSVEVQPSRYGTLRMDGAHDELPPRPAPPPPPILREHSRPSFEQNDRIGHSRPPASNADSHYGREEFFPGQPHGTHSFDSRGATRRSMDRQPDVARHDERLRREQAHADHGFDPLRSRNPFINGSRAYAFVWGDPLCVRCGMMGHLPRQCKEEELTKMEQDFLYELIGREGVRSKEKSDRRVLQRERDGLRAGSGRETPGPEGGERGRISILDAPPSPKESKGTAGARAAYGPRSEYWKQCKQEALKQQEMCESPPQADTSSTPRHHGSTHDPHEMIQRRLKQKHDRDVRSRSRWQLQQPTNEAVANEAEHGPEKARASGFTQLKSERDRTTATPTPTPTPTATTIRSLEAPVPFGSRPTPTPTMGATKRMSNGEAKVIGPHPSTIRVSAPYITQSAVEKRLQPAGLDAQERSIQEAREDSVRLQGVTWLDQVRRSLQLPIKTFTTACVYYHKFRLAHHTLDYAWADAAAASLLTSCKNEDTLKKSRDILAAAYNLKQASGHEQVGADDAIFEGPSRVVIGLERLVLESGGFDFRSRSPHHTLVKVSKSLRQSEGLRSTCQLAWTILTDLHRTFAVLKQTSATLALASLELAAHFMAATSENNTCSVRDDLQILNLDKWHTTREEVMETLLDALDLYTHHTTSTILGTKYSLDDFLRIRLALNKECSESSLPRFTVVQPPPSPDNVNGTSSSTLRVSNGHPTPVSPPQGGTQAPQPTNVNAPNLPPTPEGGGTLRFMLDPVRATEERTQVNSYYTEEWEEYEEEIEVPIPRARSRSRDRDRRRDALPERPDRDRAGGRPPRDYDDRRGTRDSPRGLAVDRAIERDRDRARTNDRDRDRDRRYDDRRDDRDRDRRYDDRRERDRYRDRRDYDDRRRGRDER